MIELDVTIRDAAKILGVHVDTMRYWEEQQLIRPPRRHPINNYRMYNAKEIIEIAKLRGIFELEVETAIKNLFYLKKI